jgi:hypothetical protein
MINPQQAAVTAMGELTWAQVMPTEAYWRERISKEIEEDESCKCLNQVCNAKERAIQIAKGIK